VNDEVDLGSTYRFGAKMYVRTLSSAKSIQLIRASRSDQNTGILFNQVHTIRHDTVRSDQEKSFASTSMPPSHHFRRPEHSGDTIVIGSPHVRKSIHRIGSHDLSEYVSRLSGQEHCTVARCPMQVFRVREDANQSLCRTTDPPSSPPRQLPFSSEEGSIRSVLFLSVPAQSASREPTRTSTHAP
jgi:hypothetical protein